MNSQYHLISCTHCGAKLYETDGAKIREPMGEAFPRRPIDVTIGRKVAITLCSTDCASKWFATQATEDLLTGYRLV